VSTPRPPRKPASARGPGRLCSLLLHFLALGLVASAGQAQPPSDPAKLIEKLRAERLRQEREFNTLVAEGKCFLQERDYQQAERLLAKAAQLRPDDQTCKALLAQARAHLTTTAPGAVLDRLKDERRFKSESLLVQLRMSIFEAQKALKGGDHVAATQHAQRVLVGVAALGDNPDAASLRAEAKKVLAQAEQAKGKAVSRQLRQAAMSAKNGAETDKAATLRALEGQGWELHERGEHQKALEVADRMLRLDQANPRAAELRRAAQRALAEHDSLEGLRRQRKEAENEHLGRLIEEEMSLSPEERAKVVLPARKGRTRQAATKPKATWETRLRESLEAPIEASIRRMTLSEACRYLSQLSGCPIIIDPKVGKDERRFSLPANMRLSLGHYLNWLCRFAKATYTLRDHAVFVTIPGGLLDEPVQKDYDISELVVPTRTVRATFTGASQVEKPSARDELLGIVQKPKEFVVKDQPADEALGNSWVEFIRSTVAPGTWERGTGAQALQEQPRYSIQYRNGRIVVVHTPEVHRQIEGLLDSFRKARNLQVHIRTRFLMLDMDFLKDIDLDFGVDQVTLSAPAALGSYGYTSNPLDPFLQLLPPGESDSSLIGTLVNDAQVGDLPGSVTRAGAFNFTYAYLGDDQVNAVIQAVLKRRKGSVLVTPWLTCFNTQRANFQAVTNFNYVRRLNADGEPEIGNVPEGLIFDVQPFVSADRRYITLVLQPQMRTLINRDFQSQAAGFQYAAGLTRVVNLPETELRSLATTVTVPDGGTLFVGGLAQARESAGEGSLPFLHGIPLLRYLFREWAEAERRESLIIMVTARILPDIFEEGQ